jgi:hypothetical protein
MDINLKRAEFHLGTGDTVRVLDSIGTVVACRDGNVWITQEQDSRDILLAAGEAFTLDRPGLAIIQALDDGHIGLDQPASQVQVTMVHDSHRWWPKALVPGTSHFLAPSGRGVAATC